MNNNETKKISSLSIKLGIEQKNLLTKIAKEKERTVHFLLCQAVKEFIEREENKIDFYETAKKAGEHFKETGLHTTHEEMKIWADSLGTTKEITPACHK